LLGTLAWSTVCEQCASPTRAHLTPHPILIVLPHCPTPPHPTPPHPTSRPWTSPCSSRPPSPRAPCLRRASTLVGWWRQGPGWVRCRACESHADAAKTSLHSCCLSDWSLSRIPRPAVERLIAYWDLPQEAPAKNPDTEPEVGAGAVDESTNVCSRPTLPACTWHIWLTTQCHRAGLQLMPPPLPPPSLCSPSGLRRAASSTATCGCATAQSWTPCCVVGAGCVGRRVVIERNLSGPRHVFACSCCDCSTRHVFITLMPVVCQRHWHHRLTHAQA